MGSSGIRETMDRETLMNMVEDAVKDVLADQEVVEYIRELIAKRLMMIMEEEALQRTVENLVDKVVGDLRLIMARQVQGIMEEKINLGIIEFTDLIPRSKDGLAVKQDEEKKNVRDKDVMDRKELGNKHTDKNLLNSDDEVGNICIKSAKASNQTIDISSERAILDKNKLKERMITNMDGEQKYSDKKKALEDLRKLMNMMEELVQGSRDGGLVDEEIVGGIISLMNKEQEAGKVKVKSINKVEAKRSTENMKKVTQARKMLKNKKAVENLEDIVELDALIGKKTHKVKEEPTGEPVRLDSDEDISEEGMDMTEMLRLKRIISAMNKYMVGDVK